MKKWYSSVDLTHQSKLIQLPSLPKGEEWFGPWQDFGPDFVPSQELRRSKREADDESATTKRNEEMVR